MAKGLSIQIKGIENTKRFLKTKSKEVIELADNAVTKATLFMESEVKQSIAGHRAEPKSVDTGRFLNSVKGVKPNKLQGQIETNVPYAKNLEYGTSRMTARSHFRNSARRNRNNIKEFIEKEGAKI